MTLRLFGAGALALAMLLFALTTPPAVAQQCGRLDRSRGAILSIPCPTEGRAVKRDRRHFRESHKARRGVVSPGVSAAAGGQTDNDGRPIAADQAGPVAAASAQGPWRAAHRGASVRLARGGTSAGVSLVGIVAPLAAKAAEIVSACGSRVVSGVRHTFVAGTRTLSLHASGRAVDMVGNPSCIYRILAGWPGGYTTDYGRVRHVHISHGGREHGLRFAHGGHRHSKHRSVARARRLAGS